MAIKIIKNTMVDPIEMTCECCKSVFSYNYQDIQARERNGLFGFEYRDRFVQCPVCKSQNNLEIIKIADEEKDESGREHQMDERQN